MEESAGKVEGMDKKSKVLLWVIVVAMKKN